MVYFDVSYHFLDHVYPHISQIIESCRAEINKFVKENAENINQHKAELNAIEQQNKDSVSREPNATSDSAKIAFVLDWK